jgi:hypothetical protein
MKPPEVFGIFIRCAGLVIVFFSLSSLSQAVFMLVHNTTTGFLTLLLFGILALIIGVWFIRGAPWLISFSYRQDSMKEE